VASLAGKFGFIDRRGDFVIPARFDYAEEFDDKGLARVTLAGRQGMIDRHGHMVVPALYDRIEPFANGLAVVSLKGLRGAVDARGRVVTPIKFKGLGSFSRRGWAVASLDVPFAVFGTSKPSHWGVIDRMGRWVIPPRYAGIRLPDEGSRLQRAPSGLAMAWRIDAGVQTTTYLDRKGREILTLPLGFVGETANDKGLIRVSYERRYALFDPSKPRSGPFWLQSIGEFDSSGLAPAENDNLWGYIDQSGSFAISPRFTSAHQFADDGLARVTVPGSPGVAFIDRTGQIQLQTRYNAVTDFGPSGSAKIWAMRPPDQSIGEPATACGPRAVAKD
jgi:hypothetical protein